jgi:hypothetical protein
MLFQISTSLFPSFDVDLKYHLLSPETPRPRKEGILRGNNRIRKHEIEI